MIYGLRMVGAKHSVLKKAEWFKRKDEDWPVPAVPDQARSSVELKEHFYYFNGSAAASGEFRFFFFKKIFF
jgi:hypothetical protein